MSLEATCFVYSCNVRNYNERVVAGYTVLLLFACVDVVRVCETARLFFFLAFFFLGFDIRFRLLDLGLRRSLDFVFLLFSFFHFLVAFCLRNRHLGERREFDGHRRFVLFLFDVHHSGRSRSTNCGNCRSENQ